MECMLATHDAPLTGISLTLYSDTPSDTVVQAGSTICGVLRTVVTKPIHCKGLHMEVLGISHTAWSTGSGKHRRHHSETVSLFSPITIDLMGEPEGAPGGARYVMPLGDHAYPFSIPAPPLGVPPSAEHGHGHIRYVLRAHLDIPNWPDATLDHTFTLASCQAPPPHMLQAPPGQVQQQVVPLSAFMCCGDGGLATLDLGTAQAIIPVAESFPLSVLAGARATTDKKLEATLRVLRVVSLRCSGHHRGTRQELASAILPVELHKKAEGVAAHSQPPPALVGAVLPMECTSPSYTSPLIDVCAWPPAQKGEKAPPTHPPTHTHVLPPHPPCARTNPLAAAYVLELTLEVPWAVNAEMQQELWVTDL